MLPDSEGKEAAIHARPKDIFLTTLFVMVDDFYQAHPQRRNPARECQLEQEEDLEGIRRYLS